MTAAGPTRYGISVSGPRKTDHERIATAIDLYATRWGTRPTVVHVPPDKAEAYAACCDMVVMPDENVPDHVFHFVRPEEDAAA